MYSESYSTCSALFGSINPRSKKCLSLNLIIPPPGLLRLGLRTSTPTAHHPSTDLPLDPAPHTNLLIKDELPNHMRPAAMLRQSLVELAGNLVQLWQSGPRNGREIVMFVVQPDVISNPVQWTIVTERLRHRDLVRRVARLGGDLFVDVVLCDEVAGCGVQTAGEEG